MHDHSKKKSKEHTKIKSEPKEQEIFPLSHYVDDRVELIRQMFLCLKSKTIKNIAPDFLQAETIEQIQEYCLNELLGISTKRLLSIINSTKCPADTESSDSDVERIQEHISLEEISSDSGDEERKSKIKKKTKRAAGGQNSTNGTSTDKADQPGQGKKPISVLELLELQARARAIRSQLALEPVTKIEIDSDKEDGASSKKSMNDKSAPSTSKTAQPEVSSNNGHHSKENPKEPEHKPVRLKRNFRQRQCENYEEDAEENQKEGTETIDKPQETNGSVIEKPVEEKPTEPEPLVVKEKSKERSLSPDVVTIVPSPETYCISSESENEDENFLKKIKNTHYITIPVVTSEKRPETEDEKFLKKIKSSTGEIVEKTVKTVSGTDNETFIAEKEIVSPDDAKSMAIECVTNATIENSTGASENIEKTEASKIVEEEHEEGELTDEEEAANSKELSSDEQQNTTVSTDKENKSTESIALDVSSEIHISDSETEDEKNKNPDHQMSSDEDSSSSNSDGSDNENVTQKTLVTNIEQPKTIESIEIDDDDIIDLGKDEELDFEMTDEVVPDKKDQTEYIPKKKAKKEKNEKSANAEETDTWGTRWLRGKNVTKVMATSRLANKVRTKIKQNKQTKKELEVEKLAEQQAQLAAAEELKKLEPPPSNCEVGSVQHYEELTMKNIDSKKE